MYLYVNCHLFKAIKHSTYPGHAGETLDPRLPFSIYPGYIISMYDGPWGFFTYPHAALFAVNVSQTLNSPLSIQAIANSLNSP